MLRGTPTVTLQASDGSNFSIAGVQSATVNSNACVLYYLPNCAAGITSVTLTTSSSIIEYIYLAEFSGVATVSPLDKTATNNALTQTTYTMGGVTTTADHELQVGCIYSQTSAVNDPTGWTPIYKNVDAQAHGYRNSFYYQADSGTAGAEDFTGSFTATSSYCGCMATFKAAVSGTSYANSVSFAQSNGVAAAGANSIPASSPIALASALAAAGARSIPTSSLISLASALAAVAGNSIPGSSPISLASAIGAAGARSLALSASIATSLTVAELAKLTISGAISIDVSEAMAIASSPIYNSAISLGLTHALASAITKILSDAVEIGAIAGILGISDLVTITGELGYLVASTLRVISSLVASGAIATTALDADSLALINALDILDFESDVAVDIENGSSNPGLS